MIKYLAVVAGLSMVSGAALAADLAPAPMPMPQTAAVVQPTSNWTGFYLNAGAGYGFWESDETTISAVTGANLSSTQSFGGKGYIGLVGGGFDYDFGSLSLGPWTPHIVAGLFGDYDFESLKGTIQDAAAAISGTIKETDSWAAGARIGLVPFPQMLTYTNGGVTGTHFGSSTLSTLAGVPTTGGTSSFNKVGYFLGGGTETSLSPLLPNGFFLRSEYRYSYFGTARVTETGVAAGDAINFKPTVQTITTSLIYKF